MRYDLEEAAAVLGRTPSVLDALLRGLPEAWTTAREPARAPNGPRRGGAPSGWSPREVVAHLVHGERTDWIPRARIILEAGESRAFEPFDMEGHRADAARDLGALLDEFARLRAEGLRALRGMRLSTADLDRRGRHPEFGPVTLRQHLATWVAHDLGHVRQICRVMAKRYTDDVGPWRAYLPVLSE